jgi:hypothetical protein
LLALFLHEKMSKRAKLDVSNATDSENEHDERVPSISGAGALPSVSGGSASGVGAAGGSGAKRAHVALSKPTNAAFFKKVRSQRYLLSAVFQKEEGGAGRTAQAT